MNLFSYRNRFTPLFIAITDRSSIAKLLWIPLLALFISMSRSPLCALESQPPSRSDLLPEYKSRKILALKGTADYLNVLFQTRYGPIRWKQIRWGWDPEEQTAIAKEQIDALEDEELDSFKPIFNRLMDSTRDGHVSITYVDSRSAKLPFKAAWIDNKVIVTKSQLASLKAGDEIVSIDNQPVLDFISQALYGVDADQVPFARLHRSMNRAFSRYGYRDAMPKNLEGVVRIVGKRGDKAIKAVAIWDFNPDIHKKSTEERLYSMEAIDKEESLIDSSHLPQALASQLLKKRERLLTPLEKRKPASHSMKRGMKSSSREDFHSPHWNLREVRGTSIAYFRLPDFTNEDNITVLDQAIPQMMKSSQALLIDLRGNGGGYELMCFAILSRLSQKPLINVLESELLDIENINMARKRADFYADLLESTRSDEEVQELFLDQYDYSIGERNNILGLHVNRELIKGWMLHYRACIEEWEAGFTCSRFTPASGSTAIQPHSGALYTKPIYLLIDEKSASCGDMLPAILRDNNRATLIGRTTAGLGGTIHDYTLPNFCGIDEFTLTHSLLLRNNQCVIEDLGVDPHYEYRLTLEDILKPKIELDRSLELIVDQLEAAKSQKQI